MLTHISDFKPMFWKKDYRTGIFASRWPALPSVPACCNSKFTHICISSKRKNLLVLNVRVLGVLVQALFTFKWPVLPSFKLQFGVHFKERKKSDHAAH